MSKPYKHCRFCGGQGCLACHGEQRKDAVKAAWESIPNADQVAKCSRCGVAVKVASHRRSNAEILRLSKTTTGVCANCAVTEFLYNTYPANSIIDERGPEMLLHPQVGEAFVQSGLMGRADMDIREVNWQTVVANWYLPVKVAKNNPRNPYRIGDAKRQREALRQYVQSDADCKASIATALKETFGGDFDVDIKGGSIVARKRKAN